MSFDICVQFYRLGAPGRVSLDSLRRAFGPWREARSATHWHLAYDECNVCELDLSLWADDPESARRFTVHRPCGDLRLWDALARVLACGPAVLFFPGEQPPLVASAQVVADLPPDLLKALGSPSVATHGAAILEAIRRA